MSEQATIEGVEPVTSQSTEVAVVTTTVEEYNVLVAGINEMLKYKDVAFDVRTTKGDQEARQIRQKAVRTRTTLEKVCKEANARDRASIADRINLRNSEADRLTAIAREVETNADLQITAEEERKAREKAERDRIEKERVDAIQQRISDIANVALRAAGQSSADIQAKIALVTRQDLAAADFDEFLAAAVNTKAETLLRLTELHAAALHAEQAAEEARRNAEELAKLRAENLVREQREAEERRLKEDADAAAVLQEMERLAAERRKHDAESALRMSQIQAATALVGEIQRIQRRAFSASSAGLLELATLVEAIQVGDELGDSAGVAQKAKDDALQTLHEGHAFAVVREEQQRADRKAREAAEAERAAAQDTQMAMQEIQAIQHQVLIAQAGRLGVRTGGTIDCIRETLAETERWTIDERFGGMQGIAQITKDKALADIRALLMVAEEAAAQASAEPASPVVQAAVESHVETAPAVQAAQLAEVPSMNIGAIEDVFGFRLAKEFIQDVIGVPVRDQQKRALLWYRSDILLMCDGLDKRIAEVRARFAGN